MLAIDKVAFTLGGIEVRWYGIIIATGALLAALLSTRIARLRDEDPDHIWQVFPWALIGGIIGARLGFFISDPAAWRGLESINPLSGGFQGLSIQGAVVGGILAGFIYTRIAKFSLFRLMDIAAPGLALAQGIGRLGNFVNQEAYGTPCAPDEPFCITIDNPPATYQNQNIHQFHPTFAYEMAWNFINAIICFWLNLPGQQKRFALRDGDVFWIYAIIYSIGRFVIEAIRIDSSMAGDVKVPQLFAIVTIVVAIGFIIYNHRTRRSNSEIAAEADASDTEATDEGELIPASAIAATVNTTAQRNVRFTSGGKAATSDDEGMLDSAAAEDDADVAINVADDHAPTDAVAAADDAAEANAEHAQETAAAAAAWLEPPLGMGMTATEPGGGTLNAAEVNAGEQLLADESRKTRKDAEDAEGLSRRHAPSSPTPPPIAGGGRRWAIVVAINIVVWDTPSPPTPPPIAVEGRRFCEGHRSMATG